MIRTIILWGIWLSFVSYTLWLNPLGQPETWPIVAHLLTFQLSEVNHYLVAIFWLMGVWPMIYACLMFLDGQMQNIPAWPFFIGSNFLGLLWLMPYFLFRQRNQTFDGNKDRWLTLLDRRSTGVVLLMVTLFLIFYALLTGDWEEFIRQFQQLTFVHLITLDFILMGLVFPITPLFSDDRARHGQFDSRQFWAIALVPLFGPLLYLCGRPPLQSNRN